jgi:hypothetical protein
MDSLFHDGIATTPSRNPKMSLADAQFRVVQLHVADLEREFSRARNADLPFGRALRGLANALRSARS